MSKIILATSALRGKLPPTQNANPKQLTEIELRIELQRLESLLSSGELCCYDSRRLSKVRKCIAALDALKKDDDSTEVTAKEARLAIGEWMARSTYGENEYGS